MAAADSCSTAACSSRRRRNRFADDPPARCRPWTLRVPTFDDSSFSPTNTPDRVAAQAHQHHADVASRSSASMHGPQRTRSYVISCDIPNAGRTVSVSPARSNVASPPA